MRSDAESTRRVTVSYEADAPRRRDALAVLLGRWKPTVRRVERLTLAGASEVIKDSWTPETMEQAFYNNSGPFMVP